MIRTNINRCEIERVEATNVDKNQAIEIAKDLGYVKQFPEIPKLIKECKYKADISYVMKQVRSQMTW